MAKNRKCNHSRFMLCRSYANICDGGWTELCVLFKSGLINFRMVDVTEKIDSIKLLLISDIHCVGSRTFAFSRIVGEAKSTEQIQKDLAELLGRFLKIVDYVLIAGDFTDNGRTDQYEAVMSVLDRCDPERFCVVPGNHDTANFNNLESWNVRMRRFKKYMREFLHETNTPESSKEYFPYIRELGRGFALIGLDSTLARSAMGQLGMRQLDMLRWFLTTAEYKGKHKIILLHHDATGNKKIFNGFEIYYGNVLKDKEEFVDIIKAHVERNEGGGLTIINGHTHLKLIDKKSIPGANIFTVPSFGSRFEEDCIAVELFQDGTFRELEYYAGNVRTRLLKKYGKFVFPHTHT